MLGMSGGSTCGGTRRSCAKARRMRSKGWNRSRMAGRGRGATRSPRSATPRGCCSRVRPTWCRRRRSPTRRGRSRASASSRSSRRWTRSCSGSTRPSRSAATPSLPPTPSLASTNSARSPHDARRSTSSSSGTSSCRTSPAATCRRRRRRCCRRRSWRRSANSATRRPISPPPPRSSVVSSLSVWRSTRRGWRGGCSPTTQSMWRTRRRRRICSNVSSSRLRCGSSSVSDSSPARLALPASRCHVAPSPPSLASSGRCAAAPSKR